MPRPCSCTPEAIAAIKAHVLNGSPIPIACEAAGYLWTTVKNWLEFGNKGREPYATFVAEMNEAKAKWAASATASVHTANDWKAQAWLLERRVPEFAPPRFKHELSGPDGGPIQTASMSDAEIEAKLLELARTRTEVLPEGAVVPFVADVGVDPEPEQIPCPECAYPLLHEGQEHLCVREAEAGSEGAA